MIALQNVSFSMTFFKNIFILQKSIKGSQISGTELHHKLFLQRKLTGSFTGLSG